MKPTPCIQFPTTAPTQSSCILFKEALSFTCLYNVLFMRAVFSQNILQEMGLSARLHKHFISKENKSSSMRMVRILGKIGTKLLFMKCPSSSTKGTRQDDGFRSMGFPFQTCYTFFRGLRI